MKSGTFPVHVQSILGHVFLKVQLVSVAWVLRNICWKFGKSILAVFEWERVVTYEVSQVWPWYATFDMLLFRLGMCENAILTLKQMQITTCSGSKNWNVPKGICLSPSHHSSYIASLLLDTIPAVMLTVTTASMWWGTKTLWSLKKKSLPTTERTSIKWRWKKLFHLHS